MGNRRVRSDSWIQEIAWLAFAVSWIGSGCAGSSSPGTATSDKSKPRPAVAKKIELKTTQTVEDRFAESRFYRSEDKFLAADSPAVCPAEQATFVDDNDEVLGFIVGGKARAYPLHSLCYHHVVNDTIGDTPIAVTY